MLIQINVNNNNREYDADNRVEDMRSESKNTEEFDAILKDLRNNGRNTK